MIKFLVVTMLTVFGAVLALAALVLLPLLFIGVLCRFLLAVVLLPFRILRFLFGLGFGVLTGVAKVFFWVVSGLLGLLLLVGAVLFVPLVPLLMIGLGGWLLFRLFRRRPVYAARPARA